MAETETLAALGVGVRLGGRPVLSGVDVVFRRGEVAVVLGPNGAGKSTLLACLSALRAPQAGRAVLGGRDLRDISARDRARRIAILPQSHEIAWAVDVEVLVSLGRLPHQGPLGGAPGRGDHDAVERAMAAAGVTALRHRVATSLSGGERARVLLARALAGEPDWLLADEPLTGLDPGHQLDACDLFRAVADKGAGVVLTLHDLQLAARIADRIIVLNKGEVVADGPPVDSLTSNLMASVYGIEARVAHGPGGLDIAIIGRV